MCALEVLISLRVRVLLRFRGVEYPAPMAYLDPAEAFAHFRDRTIEGIQSHFPIKGKLQTLYLKKIEVKDDLHPDDLRLQHKAKVEGGSYAVPVFGELELVDNITGKTVDRRRIRLAEIPKQTQRYSYILDGQEYQIDNQWQLKPGAYTRRRQNGELETRFNVANKTPFDMVFDPGTKQFVIEYNKAKLPAYPIFKVMGLDDHTIEKALGKEVFEANKNARGVAGTVEKFYKTDRREAPPSKEIAEKHLYETFVGSKMRPEATALTLGKPIDHVNGEALLLAAQKLMKVQSGHPEDDRDSLMFKDLRSAGDFVFDKLRGAAKVISAKTARKINQANDIRDIVKFDLFNDPIKQTFHKNSAARIATQINPVEMVSSSLQTTIMGPGGIKSEKSITDEAKFVNPSHLGFLDPIHTPEGSKTGVTLRLPLGVKKVGNEPKIPLYNLKTQQTELVSPGDFVTKNVVLPDQVKWENGKPRPIGSTVKIVGPNNEMKDGKFDDAHYVMRHPSQLFNMTSNLIPFLGNTSGNRASMASRHIEQAISLLHREEPLVQVSTGVDKPNMNSFERVLGTQASHQAPIDGVVHAVKSDAIVLKGKDGKIREVHIYNNYPLNDAKSVLHSTPTVKVGDRVKAGQVIADTNFSKNGTLALGTNLRVAYIPFKGYNFEDGVVISESAAKKLASVHLYKPVLAVDEKTILGRRKFEIHHPGLFKKDQMEHIGEDGLPKIGARVRPGDPLILAVKPFEIKDRTGVAAIRKSITGTHTDKSLRWDGEGEGEVVGITRSKDGIQVHVKTIEPMQVGDKIAGRYGNKGIVTMILPDKEMPRTKDGKHIEVALNPSGVPGRMNVGQVLETAASKIAEKLGKPYVAPSFQKDADMVAHVQAELKKHGLSDQEDIYDPVTGQPLGKALVGKQHILKLVHQVDKKVAVAPGMGLPGLPSTDKYDINLQPKAGQRIGSLGMYALLAHGAKANLREMQTWKGEGPDPQTNEAKRWPSQHNQVWKAIQTGEPLPTPKPTFAFKKFEDLLRGAGVNIEKKGHEFVLSPLTDKHILELTGDRVLPRPGERLEAKIDKNTGELKPRPGGLFDEKLTGGHGGTKWSRIPLAEPVPNPLFETPIRVLTGLSQKDFNAVIAGEKGIHPNGTLANLGKGVFTGGHAIEHMLKQIDVKKELSKAQAALNNAKAADVDPLLKKVKYLRALDQLGMKPHEAYILKNIPVIPPVMRPASLMQDGNIKYADINQLYSDFAQVNDQLKDPTILRNFTESRKSELRRNLYDGVKAIIGYGIPYKDAEHKGLLHMLSGASPKSGFFQRALVQKRQDLTMRSTIVPEPALGLDEVGLPKTHALDLFRPFVVKKLQEMGAAPTPLDAQKMLAQRSEPVWRALDKVMEERPVLLKRDPALHKYSVQAFQAKAVEGNAIKIHPLVCGGFNADFDGDQQLGQVVLFVRDSVMQRGLAQGKVRATHLGEAPWPDALWWSLRKVGPEMAARFHELVGYVFQGDFYFCDLADFPHAEEKVTQGHIDFHPVPEGLQVLAFDEQTKKLTLADVRYWSRHTGRLVEIVTLASGRQIVTDDDPRAVYGLDSDLNFVRRRPSESLGLFVPVMADGEVKTSRRALPLPEGDDRLRASFDLDARAGRLLGTLVGDGWVVRANGTLKGVAIAAAESSVAVGFTQDLLALFKEIPLVSLTERIGGDFGESVESRRYVVNSTAAAKFIAPLIGHGAAQKHLPPFFLTAPRDFRLGLLAGLIDTDGSISVSNAKDKPQYLISLSTTSTRLAYEVVSLARSLSVRAKMTAGKTLKKQPVWTVNFSTVDFHTLGELPLNHVKKAEAFRSFIQGPCPSRKQAHARLDIIPTPRGVAKQLRDRIGTSLGQSVYVVLSNAMDREYVSRSSALEILDRIPTLPSENECFWRWSCLARDMGVRWDRVVSFEKTGIVENGYDLTVPGFETFMSVDGVVLSNTMSVFVPISREAVNEAHKMKPTQNLFAESTGKIAFSPTLESALGIYKLSLTGKDTGKSFSNPGAVLDAVRQGKLKHDDVVSLNGKKTTPGRVLLSTALPPAMQDDILYNLDHRLDKKGLEGLLTRLGKDHKADFDRAVNRLKDLGNDASFGAVAVPLPHTTIANLTDPKKNVFVPIGTHSLGLADFAADKTVRNQVLSKADKEAAAIRSSPLPEAEKNRRIVAIYSKADQEMKALHEKKLEKKPTNLFTMYKAGVKPGWDQYKQMVLAPMLLKDSSDRVIPMPVTKSYSEGLDVGSYWTQMHGARRGSVLKVQEVQEPGYMSKLLMNNTMDLLVGSKDCGTTRGIAMGVHEKDIHDRVLAQDFTHGKLHVKAGTVLTPDITGQIKAVDKNAKLLVRSPLKCEHEKGICQKCLGVGSHGDFHDVGTNAGIHAAHAVGERAVQLTLKSFHTGGVVEQSGGKLLNSFARFEQLTMLPKKIPNAASLAMTSGKIEKIEPTSTGANVYINGKKHFVGKDAAGHPLHQPYGSSNWTGLKVGQYVTAGSPLSDPARTFVNPHDLYKATGSIDKVQNHLVSEMYDLYKDEGIKRRHIETVVKAMSNLTKVVHPGDAVGVLRGEFQPLSVVQKQNSELVKAGRRPIEHTPVLKGINMMPLSLQEDWMAKLQHQKLRSTIAEAAALGSRSNIHGTHPIPAIAYGAELGLTRAHHLRPGFGHLKNVPEHHY